MSIKRISSEEFTRLAPNLRAFTYPDKEMDWYASSRLEVIAKLVIDQGEKTWMGYVWVRDENGKFGAGETGQYNHTAVAGIPYAVKSESQARSLLEKEINTQLRRHKQPSAGTWWQFWKRDRAVTAPTPEGEIAHLASQLANSGAAKSYRIRPFIPTDSTPTLKDAGWSWKAIRPVGKGAIEANITISRDRTQHTVDVRWLDSAPQT